MTWRDTGHTGQLDGFPDLDGGGSFGHKDFDFIEVRNTCFCFVSNILTMYNVVGSQCDHKQYDYGSRYSWSPIDLESFYSQSVSFTALEAPRTQK